MKLIKIKEEQNGRPTFELQGANFGFANSLRRAMMEDVPTMAIDTIEIRENSSILYDEMLAMRLGLVPLATDLKGYRMVTEDDELSAANSVQLTLKTNKEGMIGASELNSNDPKIAPVVDVPVVKLFKGQELDVTCTARLGLGSEHMKWSPCLAWYRYKKDVKGKLKAEEKENLIYGPFNDTEPEGAEVKESETDFVFFVEPWGQLPAKEIVTTALERLGNSVEELRQALQ